MIDKILPVIIADLNNYLKHAQGDTEDRVILSSLVDQSGALAFTGNNRVICTVTAIQVDKSGASNTNYSTRGNNAFVRKSPPMLLELQLLFSAYFPGNYVEAMKFLSLLLGFFQQKPSFDETNTPALTGLTNRVTIEMQKLSLDQSINLWNALGAKMMPALNMKMRLIGDFEAHGLVEEVPTVKGE